MNTFCLRDYQSRSVLNVLEKLRDRKATVLVAPTGAGKTAIAREVATHFSAPLLVAHRIEIVEQAKALGLNALTIQRAMKRGPSDVDLLIIDEAHRATADTYQALIRKYRGAALLGLTATPQRTDGKGLCDTFSEMVDSVTIKELVEQGHLVPYRAFGPKIESLKKLQRIKRRGGDYATSELSALMDRPRLVSDVVHEYKKHAMGRPAVVFAVSVKHSRNLERAFLKNGIRAIHLDGRATESKRESALAMLAAGEIDVLCNVNLFTEGWDCPAVSCVVMARPTESLTLYLQSIGRGMRPHPGKSDLIILDHAGNIDKHGEPDAPRAWSLESEKERAKREAEVSELERLYALGFSSIEEELEEKRRSTELSYHSSEVRKMLGIQHKGMADFLRRRGVFPVPDFRGTSVRYHKSDIDKIIASLPNRSQYYSFSEASDAVNLGRKALMSLAARFDIQTTKDQALGPLYLKKSVDAAVSLIRENYSTKQVADMLGKGNTQGIANFLLVRGVKAIGGLKGTLTRYHREDVDRMLNQLKSQELQCKNASRAMADARAHLEGGCYSLRQVEQITGKSHGSVQVWLSRKGINPARLGHCNRYPKDMVDSAAREICNSYTKRDLVKILGLKSPWDWLKRNGIKPLPGYGSRDSRYSKADVDSALPKS